jgi:membrane-bound ClpP family serine protease
LKVGLPTFAFMLAMVGLFLIRLRLKIFTKASVVDYVFSGFSIICLSIGFGDLAFHQFNGISWSEPLWICGITLFVLELLIAGVRKIRTFFNARNGRQG